MNSFRWVMNCRSTEIPNVVAIFTNGKTVRENARIKKHDGRSFIGWKKAMLKDAYLKDSSYRFCLVKLQISSRAVRFQPNNYKCRASSAKVLGIYALPEGHQDVEECLLKRRKTAMAHRGRTNRKHRFTYCVGKTVKPKKKFEKNHRQTCASGIHFFLTVQEAVDYNL